MRSIFKVCFWLLLLGTTFGFSQSTKQLVQEVTIYFESASSTISKSESIKTEEILQSLTDLHQYSIELSAHTDSEGSTSYNNNLSAQRALAVADFFVKRGFFNRKISYVAQGENQPVAENETNLGKAQNRRVTVKIHKKPDDKLSVGGFTIEEKIFAFSADNPQKLEYPSGTIIAIPENAFVDKNGNPVVGEVNLNYIEYRDPVDFILGNIPMEYHHDGENFIFNSGGMFKIKATHNGEEIFLDKDKNIELDFPLTDDLPDLNFYRFDETTNQWVEKAKNITGKTEVEKQADLTPFLRLQPPSRNTTTGDTISFVNNNRIFAPGQQNTSQCYSVSQKLKMGKLLASSTETLYEKTNWTSLKIKPVNLKKQKILDFQISNAERIKKAHLNNQKNYAVKCRITTESDNTIKFTTSTNSYPDKLNDIRWISSTSVENLSRNSDRLVSIKKLASNSYTITIQDSLGKKEMENLKIADFNQQKEAIVTNISNQINNRQIQIKRLENLAKNQDLIIGNKTNSLNNLKKIRYTTSDTIGMYNYLVKEFWKFNQEFMTPQEKEMVMKDWIHYFDNNKKLMLTRYDEVAANDAKECLSRIREMERAQKKATVIRNADAAVRQKLSISSLGIYNCDQIQKLFEPLIVRADYTDENGNKITPIYIYIVDKNLNGILKYDGYNGYSPGRFAYSPSSETTLLAFDADGSVYIYTKEKMKNLDTSKSQQLFELKKISSVSNKEELTALLN